MRGEEDAGQPYLRRLIARCRPVLAAGLLLVVATACVNSAPTTRAALCQKFDALGEELLSPHLVSDNAVFRRVGDLADAAKRYDASSSVRSEAERIRKIADSDSTSGDQLLNATQAIADECGHPLGIGSGFP